MMCGGGASRVTGPRHSASCTSSAQSPQSCEGIGVPLRGGEAVQSDGLCPVLGNTFTVFFTVFQHVAQVVLSVCKPLRCCKAVESHSLGIILRNTLTVLKHVAQVVLSGWMPLCHCQAVESHSLGIVLHNTLAVARR